MRFDAQRFSKFVLSGGLAAAVNVALRWLFDIAMPFEVAVILSYMIAMTLAFFLAKTFVFSQSDLPVRHQFLRFAMVNAVSLLIVWSVSVGLYRFVFPVVAMTWRPDTVAHLIGVLSPVFAAYILHKNYSFASDIPPPKD